MRFQNVALRCEIYETIAEAKIAHLGMRISELMIKIYQKAMYTVILVCLIGSGVSFSKAQTVESSRQDLVSQYVAALNACDIEQFDAMLHANHAGYAIRGPLGEGMNAEMLRKQCEAGFALDLRPTKTTWLTPGSEPLQIAGIELTGSLSHPVRGTNVNNLRITMVAEKNASGQFEIVHTHYSSLR